MDYEPVFAGIKCRKKYRVLCRLWDPAGMTMCKQFYLVKKRASPGNPGVKHTVPRIEHGYVRAADWDAEPESIVMYKQGKTQ